MEDGGWRERMLGKGGTRSAVYKHQVPMGKAIVYEMGKCGKRLSHAGRVRTAKGRRLHQLPP